MLQCMCLYCRQRIKIMHASDRCSKTRRHTMGSARRDCGWYCHVTGLRLGRIVIAVWLKCSSFPSSRGIVTCTNRSAGHVVGARDVLSGHNARAGWNFAAGLDRQAINLSPANTAIDQSNARKSRQDCSKINLTETEVRAVSNPRYATCSWISWQL